MPSDPKREVTRIRLRSLSRMSPLALPAILPKFPFALSQRYTCRSSRSMNLLVVMTHRKNLSEYQFESGTSHLRCLRLAFREGLPRRHVCGKNISLSLSLSLSHVRSPALLFPRALRRVWEPNVRVAQVAHGRVLVPWLVSMCRQSLDTNRMWVGR
jgi:hypothetical protein